MTIQTTEKTNVSSTKLKVKPHINISLEKVAKTLTYSVCVKVCVGSYVGLPEDGQAFWVHEISCKIF